MEYLVIVKNAGVCLGAFPTEKIDGLTIEVTKRSIPVKDKSKFNHPQEVSAYWLFVDDVDRYFDAGMESADQKMAANVWPGCEEKARYHQLAHELKEKIRRQGAISKKRDEFHISKRTLQMLEDYL